MSNPLYPYGNPYWIPPNPYPQQVSNQQVPLPQWQPQFYVPIPYNTPIAVTPEHSFQVLGPAANSSSQPVPSYAALFQQQHPQVYGQYIPTPIPRSIQVLNNQSLPTYPFLFRLQNPQAYSQNIPNPISYATEVTSDQFDSPLSPQQNLHVSTQYTYPISHEIEIPQTRPSDESNPPQPPRSELICDEGSLPPSPPSVTTHTPDDEQPVETLKKKE